MNTTEQLQQSLLAVLIERETVTRSEFAAAGNHRLATVLRAVNDLKERGLVIEPERNGNEKTGRRSPALYLDPEAASFAGVEVTARAVYMGVYDLRGRALERERHPLDAPPRPDGLEAWLAPRIAAVRARHPSLMGIVLADPGMVDTERQVSLRAVHIPEWENVPSGDILRRASGLSATLVVGETGARAYLEYAARRAGLKGNLFLLRLDDDVGAGWIHRGELFLGDCFEAMEIGHWVIAPGGPLCRCGNRGCLEAIAGLEGVRRRVRELNDSGVRTVLDADRFDLPALARAVREGDRPARLLAEDIAEQAAPVFAVVAALLNPTCVVVSGEWARLGEILTPAVGRALRERCLPSVSESVRLEFSDMDEYAACAGAARLLAERQLLAGEWRKWTGTQHRM